jgi:beta-glucosidase
MIKLTLALFIFICVVFAQTPKERAKNLLSQMTQDEKIHMVCGIGAQKPYVGNVEPIDRLKIPRLNLEDGPQGVADGVRDVTCFPSTLTATASWDLSVMREYAAAIGREQRIKGTNVHLGPMVNIARVPQGGRNFESFGEDPVLSSKMAIEYIKGVQSQGVIATIKHWVCNNQEQDRDDVSANVDERTLQEIYYPAFKAGVDAGVGSVMCSYNKINNTWACENEDTLTRVLKKQMGFEGFVMSDWGGTHSTVLAANSGLDQEMPDARYFGENLKQAISSGQVPQSQLDDKVLRILTAMYAVGLFDTPQTGDLGKDAKSDLRSKLSREVAQSGAVLMKNLNNILPLKKVKSIAVIGDDANDRAVFHGDGSGGVISAYDIKPLNAIKQRVANTTYANSSNIDQAVKNAKNADVAIVFLGKTSTEGADHNLNFADHENDLVKAVASVQRNTIVVMHIPSAVVTPWADSVAAILSAFYPGQENGNVVASILFGDVNPSGKLPVTFPVNDREIPVNTQIQYPGINKQTNYSEKLQVGYRWYDANNVKPSFPFGHGLSYTTFEYSNIQIQTAKCSNGQATRDVTFDLRNNGTVDGAEVAQLYINFPSSAGEPPQQLKDFKKVLLKAGEKQRVTLSITDAALSIYDVTKAGWRVVAGTFEIRVGSSSRDIRLTTKFSNSDNICSTSSV